MATIYIFSIAKKPRGQRDSCFTVTPLGADGAAVCALFFKSVLNI